VDRAGQFPYSLSKHKELYQPLLARDGSPLFPEATSEAKLPLCYGSSQSLGFDHQKKHNIGHFQNEN